MSRSIDERIVQMEFENSSFERNAKTSLDTIEKLKNTMTFDNAIDSFKKLGDASSSFVDSFKNAFDKFDGALDKVNGVRDAVGQLMNPNVKSGFDASGIISGLGLLQNEVNSMQFDPMASALENISDRFSTMGLVGQQVIKRITDAAIDLGSKLVHSLALDQVQTGFAKYEQSTKDIIAIMNQADATEETVNKYVDTLSWYSDVTSFDTNSMTSALKTFASQGIELDKAIPVIMGIGNSVTYAGQSAKEGSAAFDAYSKAISSGFLGNREWITLQRGLGVATLGLKKQFIEAAEALGTLNYVGDGVWRTMEGLDVTIENFQTTLGHVKGKWLTTDVIMEVFGKQYGGYTERLAAFNNEYQKLNDSVVSFSESTELMAMAEETLVKESGSKLLTESIQEVEKVFGKEYAGRLLEVTDEYYAQQKAAGKVVDKTMTLKQALELAAGGAENLGLKYLLSATQARTFTEAIDAVKDASSTVWKNIFTDIFGTTTEAIEMWTNFSDALFDVFVTPLSNMRVLSKQWKELGGRTILLDALARAWKNVGLAVAPVREAFRNIFPPLTAEQLVNFTGFFNIIQRRIQMWLRFKFNTDGLRKTFEGLFATIDIVKEAFKALFDAASPLGGIFTELVNKTLDITGNFGESIVKLRDYIKEHHSLSDALSGVKGGLERFRQAIKNAFDGKNFEGATILENLVIRIRDAFIKLKDMAAPALSSIKDGFWAVIDAISKGLQNTDLNTVLNLLKGGIFTNIALNLGTFSRKLKEGFGLWDLISDVEYVFKTLGATIKAFTFNVEADALYNIAKAIGILSISLIALSSIDSEKLGASLGALGSIFVMLGVMFSAIQSNLPKVSDAAPSIGESFKRLFASITGAANGGQGAIRSSMILMSIASAILILAGALKLLSTIKQEDLIPSLATLGAIIGALWLFVKFSSFSGLAGDIGKNMLLLAGGIFILAQAVKSLGKTENVDILRNGLGALAIMLIEMTVALNLFPQKKMLKIGAGLLLTSFAIVNISAAIRLLGTMDPIQMGVALVALAGGLLVIGGALNAMKGTLGGASAMLIASAAIMLLVPSLVALGLAGPEKIGMALLELGGAMLIFGGAAFAVKKLHLAGSMLALSSAMLIFSAATAVLAGGLILLAQVPFLNLVGAIGAIALALVTFGIAAAFLQSLIVPMLTIAGVLAVIGVANAIFGASMLVVGAGLAAIGAGASLAVPLTGAIVLLAGAIALVGVGAVVGAAGVLALGAAFVILAKGALLVAPAVPVILGLAGAIALLAVSILGTLAAILYLTGHLTFADDLAAEGEKTKTSFGEIWDSIVLFFLNGLKNLLKDIPLVGGKIASSLDEKIKEIENGTMSAERSSKMTQSYIDGITGTWDLSEEDLKAAGFDGSLAVVEGVNENEGEFSKSGTNFLQGFLNGLKNKNWLSQIGSQARAIGNLAKNNVNMSLGIQSPSEEMEWSGEMTDEGFAEGLEKGLPGIDEAVGKLSDAVLEGMDFQKLAYESGYGSGSDYGDGWNEGLAQSLEQIAPNHVLSKSQLEALDFALPENFTYDLSDEFDTNPTVTPVLDLSEIQNGAGDISTILNGQSVQANIDGIDSRNSQFQDTVLYDLQSMRNDIQILAEGQRDLQARDRRLIQGIQDAFEEVGVYIDGDRIGRFVERYQNNVRRAAGV